MVGHGRITNPGLIGELRGQLPMEGAQLRGFLEELEVGYRAVMSGDKNVLYHLMEVWSYLSNSFDEPEKIRRRIYSSRCVWTTRRFSMPLAFVTVFIRMAAT